LAPIDSVSRGHVAIGLVEAAEHRFTAISAYGLMEFGYASGTILRVLADLEPLFDDPVLGASVVLAGDWNIGTWWSGADRKYAQRDGAVLALLTAYGLEDVLGAGVDSARGHLDGCPCESGDQCRHIWTYRKDDREVAYQDDYVFATPGLVSAASVPGVWDWRQGLSDHAPLVIELSS
jgi:exonuclease III